MHRPLRQRTDVDDHVYVVRLGKETQVGIVRVPTCVCLCVYVNVGTLSKAAPCEGTANRPDFIGQFLSQEGLSVLAPLPGIPRRDGGVQLWAAPAFARWSTFTRPKSISGQNSHEFSDPTG